MLEQQGNSLTFVVFYTESKVGKTGLTVTVDVWEGTNEIVTAGSATEQGDGLYYYTLASGSVDANALYIAVFKTATTTVDQQHIPALWIVGRTWVNNVNATISSRSSHSAADVWTSATRTLTSFGTLVADIWANVTRTLTSGVPSAADIWAYAVRTLTSRANQSDDDTDPEIIRLTRGDSYSKSWADLGAVTGYTKLWKTDKENESQPDNDAITQTVLGSGFATTGLIRLNGEAATSTQASLTVDDAAAGDITWAIDEVATAQLAPGRYRFDIQVLVGTTITTLLKGIMIVEADYTRATS